MGQKEEAYSPEKKLQILQMSYVQTGGKSSKGTWENTDNMPKVQGNIY